MRTLLMQPSERTCGAAHEKQATEVRPMSEAPSASAVPKTTDALDEPEAEVVMAQPEHVEEAMEEEGGVCSAQLDGRSSLPQKRQYEAVMADSNECGACEAEDEEEEGETCWYQTTGCTHPGKHTGLPCSTQMMTGSRHRRRRNPEPSHRNP